MYRVLTGPGRSGIMTEEYEGFNANEAKRVYDSWASIKQYKALEWSVQLADEVGVLYEESGQRENLEVLNR